MVVNMKVISRMMYFMARVITTGLMAKYIEGSGTMGVSMDMAHVFGQMVGHTKESISLILNMGMVSFVGQVVLSMKEIGIVESSMVTVFTLQNQGRCTLEYGVMESLLKNYWFKINKNGFG